MGSILDFIEIGPGACGGCGAICDVLLDATPDLGATLQLGLDSGGPLSGLCRPCAERLHPELARGIAATEAAGLMARHQLGLPAAATVFVARAAAEDRASSLAAFTGWVYLVQGFGMTVPPPDADLSWPPFRTWAHQLATSDSAALAAAVILGATILHKDVRGAALEFRTDMSRPAAPFRLELVGWERDDLTDEAIAKLLGGRRLFRDIIEAATKASVGRPLALPAIEEVIREFKGLAARYRRDPSLNEFARHFKVDRQTVERHLKRNGYKNWSAFKAAGGNRN